MRVKKEVKKEVLKRCEGPKKEKKRKKKRNGISTMCEMEDRDDEGVVVTASYLWEGSRVSVATGARSE